MASIFSYEPDPPRISSPWLIVDESSGSPTSVAQDAKVDRSVLDSARQEVPLRSSNSGSPPPMLLSDYSITKLPPEPQTGPAEYKLHLLLRPRRKYASFSTGTHTAAPLQSKVHDEVTPAPKSQSRLTQLTTQLLWRMQQSSPYHATSTADDTPKAGKLLAGLESSRGALYEIGVSDDGILVGLTQDELEESLETLKLMASNLGCVMRVTRMLVVGDCEWREDLTAKTLTDDIETLTLAEDGVVIAPKPDLTLKKGKLWVAEALVTPDLSLMMAKKDEQVSARSAETAQSQSEQPELVATASEQLRVTLIGPTTSGKSSLLGTLSTSTLDNGRGKSRLSLLKHQHEVETGVTSSVAHELLGYKPSSTLDGPPRVINYSSGNVTTWTDIHAQAVGGRLVLVADSAGHPRFRRTTFRGLVGWAPHWTFLCIAADQSSPTPGSAESGLRLDASGADLLRAHLELCLKIERPLGIVITKMDIANKAKLRDTLAKVLTAIKETGRVPAMLPPDHAKNLLDSDLEMITDADASPVQKAVSTMDPENLNKIVPIVMTSSMKGNGIRMLHSLLSSLPLPSTPTSADYVGNALNPEQPACLFHIEDIFGLPASVSMQTSHADASLDNGSVVAGYLRFGSLSVGKSIVIGPFPSVDLDSGSDTDSSPLSSSPYSAGRKAIRRYTSEGSPGSRPLPRQSASELFRIAQRNAARYSSAPVGEWRTARIVSIRNLRLPVHRLEAGQVGTIGVVLHPMLVDESADPNELFDRSLSSVPRLRRGMVLAVPSRHMQETGLTIQAANRFTASFDDGDVNSVLPGSLVVVYIASVRASARVIRLTPHTPAVDANAENDEHSVFDEDDDDAEAEASPVFGEHGVTDVTLELVTTREWIELGSSVLMMPGSPIGSERRKKSSAGLQGFVGRIVEVAG